MTTLRFILFALNCWWIFANSLYEAYELYNQAVFCQHNSHPADEILRLYLSAISLKEDFAEAHQNIAIVYERIGNYEKAAYHHEKSFSCSVDNNFRYEAAKLT